MDQVMVALASDQRMQNVIPIFQESANYKELILVLSKERNTNEPHIRFKNSVNDFKAVMGSRLVVKTCDSFVEPYKIESTEATIESILKKYNNIQDVVVNISGGTKPMAIGALRASHSLGVPCIYTDTEDGEILKMYPDGSTEREPMVVRGIDVSIYMRAYGEKIIKSTNVMDISREKIEWAKIIGDNHSIIYKKVIIPLMSKMSDTQGKKLVFPIICRIETTRKQREIIAQLAKQRLWLWNQETSEISIVDKDNASFLNGLWVEIYVAVQMQSSCYFDNVLINIELDGLKGEIDVAATINGKLVIIECKSNLKQSQQLAKLHSMCKRLGGPYSQAYYARASDAYANNIRNQCRKHKIDGEIFGAELRDIAGIINRNIRIIS